MSVEKPNRNLEQKQEPEQKEEKKVVEETKKETEQLKENVYLSQLKQIAPRYEDKFKSIKDKQELKNLLDIFQFADKILDDKARRALLKGEEVDGYVWNVPFEETLQFFEELFKVEEEKLKEEVGAIILTLDELKELEKLLSQKQTQEQLKEFIELQYKEDVPSYKIIKETKLSRKLEKMLGDKEKVRQFLDNMDKKFRILASKYLPKDISADTLYNIGTGLNVGLMSLYSTLPPQERKKFMDILESFDKTIDGKDWLDKLEGLINTVTNANQVYKVFKIFNNIKIFLDSISKKAEQLGIKGEKAWERYININNPTQFAEIFVQFEKAQLEGKSGEAQKLVDKLFEKQVDKEEERIKQINQINDNIKNYLNSLADNIDEKDVKTLLNLSKIEEKIRKKKTKIEDKIEKYVKKFKGFFDNLAKLVCLGQGDECKSEVMSVFNTIIAFILHFLKSLGLDININIEDFSKLGEKLEKFNKNIRDFFIQEVLKKTKDGKYILAEDFRENPLFKNFPKNGIKINAIDIRGNLSESTYKWFSSEGVDMKDKKAIFDFLKEKLNDKFFIDQLKQKDIKLDKYKIFDIEDNQLIINFDNLDYLLKTAYGYEDILDTLKDSEEQILRGLEIEGDKLVFKEDYPEYKKKFLNTIYPTAKQVADRLGIPVIVILSQAALESNWGRSKLAIEAKNLFGIKAGGNWKGPVYKIATTEYKNGKPYKIVAKFRKYNDWDESIKDYGQLLTLPRYQQRLAFIDKSNPKQVFEALKEAGYATDPNYDTKLTNLAYNDILNGIKKVA